MMHEGYERWQFVLAVWKVFSALVTSALRDSGDDRILELAARAGATVVAYKVRDLAETERFGDDVRELGVFIDDQC